MNLIDRIKKMPLGIRIACSVVAVAIIVAVVAVIVFSRNDYSATTMRLLRVEGTVSIEDSKGGVKPVIDNIRFQSGDALNTGSDGLASVGLDDTKIITLQNDSRAEFTKQGKHLELKLTKGAVFFNVTEKLQPDETFEIKTSTMTAGIRGTSGIVYADGNGSLIVTDGTVEVTATNPTTGETKRAMVSGGERIKVYLYNDRQEDSVEFYLDEVTEEDLSDFTLEMLVENEELLNRVCDYTGWDKDTLVGFVNDINSGKVTGQQVTLTPTPIPTSTPIPTVTPKPTSTVTPTPEPKENPTTSPTPKPDSDPDAEPSPTDDPTPSGNPTPSDNPTPTDEPTPTDNPTPTDEPTPTVEPTPAEAQIAYEYIVKDELYEDESGVRKVTVRCYVNEDKETVYEGLVDGEWVPLKYTAKTTGRYIVTTFYYEDAEYYSYSEENPDYVDVYIEFMVIKEDELYEDDEGERLVTIYYYPREESYKGLLNDEWIDLDYVYKNGSGIEEDIYYISGTEKIYYREAWGTLIDPVVNIDYTYLYTDEPYRDSTISIRSYKNEDNVTKYEGLVGGDWVPLRYQYQIQDILAGTSEADIYYIESTGEVYFYKGLSNGRLDFEKPFAPELKDGCTKTEFWGEKYNDEWIFICEDDEGNKFGYKDDEWQLLDDGVIAVPGAGVAYVIAGTQEPYFVYIEQPPHNDG